MIIPNHSQLFHQNKQSAKMFKFVVVLSVVFGVSLAQRYVHQPGLVAILRQTQDVRPDGYDWAYETENGIAAEERGQLKGSGDNTAMEAQGQFAYTSPEGQRIGLSYVANENGFQPAGDLPTPPPIPAAILRSIEWNAAHPEEERIDYNNRPLINRVIYG